MESISQKSSQALSLCLKASLAFSVFSIAAGPTALFAQGLDKDAATASATTKADQNETTVTIKARRADAGSALVEESPIGVGQAVVISAGEISKVPGDSLESIMLRNGIGAGDAGGSFGLINSPSLRGFAVQRLGGVSSSD